MSQEGSPDAQSTSVSITIPTEQLSHGQSQDQRFAVLDTLEDVLKAFDSGTLKPQLLASLVQQIQILLESAAEPQAEVQSVSVVGLGMHACTPWHASCACP